MVLEKLSKTVDFVQATTPSNANDGETWLDTSQSPPRLKVFDSSVGGFIEPRSIQNLDAPVSGAGATQTDIETAVDNSNTGATVSSNLDAPVSNAGATQTDIQNAVLSDGTPFDGSNIDASISSSRGFTSTAVTVEFANISTNLPPVSGEQPITLVNGSGFLPHFNFTNEGFSGGSTNGTKITAIKIDGTRFEFISGDSEFEKFIGAPGLPFSSSIEVLFVNQDANIDRDRNVSLEALVVLE